MNNFPDMFRAHKCLNIKKKGIYLEYSECSPLHNIQYEAKGGQMNLFTYGLYIHAVTVAIFHLNH